MAVWRPVSEAAAILGVSERTIWRRIKADSIPSRNEHGRTLVSVDCDDTIATQDSVHQLSRVAVARLSLRKLDADGLNEVLEMVQEVRQMMGREVVRSRRSFRAVATLLVMLMIAAGAGVWFHFKQVGDLRLDSDNALAAARMDHEIALRDLNAEYGVKLAAERETAARTAGQASAREQEVQRLTLQQEQALNQIRQFQEENVGLGEKMSSKLTELATSFASTSSGTSDKDARITELNQQIDSLEMQLRENERTNHTARMIESRLAAAAQRSAAKHRGLIQGLQIHLDYRRKIEKHLRDLLVSTAGAQWASSADLTGPDQREEIWLSLIGASPGEEAELDPNPPSENSAGWLPLLEAYVEGFIPTPAEAAAAPPGEVAVAQ